MYVPCGTGRWASATLRLEERCHFFDAEALRHVEKAAAARGQRGADGPLEPTHVTEESRRRAYEQSAVGCDGCGVRPCRLRRRLRGCAAREGYT